MGSRGRGLLWALAMLTVSSSSTLEAVAAPVGSGRPAARERVALLPLEIEGDLNSGWQDRIEQDLTRGFVQSGREVVSPAKVTEASGVGACTNAKCLQFLSSSTGARFLVRTKITVADRNYVIEMDIVDGTDGSLAASSHEACELCGLSEVGDLVTSQAVALRQKVDMLALAPATVAVTSEPPGAIILIDGQPAGPAPLERELPPGQHRAEARKAGYLSQVHTIDVVQGVRESVSFTLLPGADGDAVDPSRGRTDWKVPVGWTSLALGVAGVAAGATFLAIHEDPYQTRCSGPDVDALGNCRQRYRTLPHGIGFVAGGAALVVTGAALLIAARVGGGGKARVKAVARRLRLGPGALGARF